MRAHRKSLIALLILAVSFIPAVAQAQPPTVCWGRDTNDNRSTDADDFLSGTTETDIAALGDGSDQYFSDGDVDYLCGNDGSDVLVGEANDDSLDGGLGDDLIVGFERGDVLKGGFGNDTLKGGSGDDVLRSGTADDQQDDIYDGPGDDVIIGHTEDVWHRCDDGAVDDHSLFDGIVIPDPDCSV